MAKLREIERAASLLAERDSGGAGGGYELEISNQDGSKIELPAADRKAFSLGALLHAKATAHIGSLSRRLRAALESLPPPLAEEEEAELKAAIALSKGEGIDEAATREGQQEGGGEEGGGPEGGGCVASLSEAKHLLEEAEAAFALLSPRFASLGDNVALCSLECVWVVTLQQLLARSSTVEAATLDQATGATRRLERVAALLRGAWRERAVYVRLHLLQGALRLYRGEAHDARSDLARAESLRQELSICPHDQPKIASLLELGVPLRSARAALLATGKDVTRAAEFALTRHAAEVAEERDAAERRRQTRALVQSLVAMGFGPRKAAAALRRSKNDLAQAVVELTREVERGGGGGGGGGGGSGGGGGGGGGEGEGGGGGGGGAGGEGTDPSAPVSPTAHLPADAAQREANRAIDQAIEAAELGAAVAAAAGAYDEVDLRLEGLVLGHLLALVAARGA
ncbi:hypothetical protein EMIHUDRAFT_451626 [Emiliania huxleyi CCMP1516]|uniref:UBA domain-containing protein n=2 Tax=Emiliania huxleyi TaxID=2903 RepID=A0A0D3IXP0_EMIH1|nr:hypothetical protein EMIHUDRAFT_451626 [Emiliania huxleyi CCMP1516]EOD16025.1 hypothetical protein EMIHUDRAFT_451626 [Emiliania huxleyi CCMP1516]|eukprot:XP_005768454.1 hypothetical protein EMIHUDRAFT_451626 [Emiliania huxleyi CCMP1516]